MRTFILACLLACLASAHAAPDAPAVPRIRVEGGGWGGVGPAQIEPVLRAVAAELLVRLPRKLEAPIVVTHTDGNPISLYDRGEGGAYQVRLHASDARWHLYVFEFAHELCHLLSNYDENVLGSGRHNQWFEESLCETASLFALDRLAARWEGSSVPVVAQRAPRLRHFFELLIAEEHRHLPPDTSAAAWLSAEEAQLRRNPYQRRKNDLVARLLLPLFQHQPDGWDALSYLNLHPEDGGAPLAGYLSHWHDNAPVAHRTFIIDVKTLLGAHDAKPIVAVKAAPSDGPEPLGAASPLRK